jgi:hypothetical protein
MTKTRVEALFQQENRGHYTTPHVVPHGGTGFTPLMLAVAGLQSIFVLQGESQQRIGALALEGELTTYIGAMVLHRAVMDGEDRANLFAGFSIADQLHDASFGGREVIYGAGLGCLGGGAVAQHMGSDSGAVVGAAGSHRTNPGYDLLGSAILQDVTFAPHLNGGAEHIFIQMKGKEDGLYRESQPYRFAGYA